VVVNSVYVYKIRLLETGPYEQCTGHTGRTGCILYVWPYYTPNKGRQTAQKCSCSILFSMKSSQHVTRE